MDENVFIVQIIVLQVYDCQVFQKKDTISLRLLQTQILTIRKS